jgi:O-antigen ligase
MSNNQPPPAHNRNCLELGGIVVYVFLLTGSRREAPIMTDETDSTRSAKMTRALKLFQLYFLVLVCYMVAHGKLVPWSGISVARKIESMYLLLALPLFATAALVIFERKSHLHFTWRECLLAGFVAFAVLGLLYSPCPSVVRKGLWQVIAAAVLYFLLLNAGRTRRDFMALAGGFVAGGVLTSIVGIANYFSTGTAGTTAWGHYNSLGMFLELPIALVLAATTLYLRNWRVLAAAIPALALLLLGAYVTHSRGTWLACTVIVLLVTALAGRKGLVVGGSIAALGLLVFIVSPPAAFREQGLRGILRMHDDSMQQRRRDVWPAATAMIGERPLLGYGLNTYREVYAGKHGIEDPDYGKISQPEYLHKLRGNVHAHNELLQAWTSMGIAGLFFYGAAFLSVVLTYIRLRRLKPDKFFAAVSLGVAAWYVGHTVHGIFDCFFFSTLAFASAAVMFALLFGAYYSQRDEKTPRNNGNASV